MGDRQPAGRRRRARSARRCCQPQLPHRDGAAHRVDGLWPKPPFLADGEPALRAQVLRRADIELDPLRHTARRAGRSLELSAKEFTLLKALMGTPAVLSAEDLLEQVWDEHTDPFTNAVKVTISRLRKKLGDPPAIENIARVGYRLIDAPNGRPTPERTS